METTYYSAMQAELQPGCFTEETLQHLFSAGAMDRDMLHLVRCKGCAERVRRYAEALQWMPTVEAVESRSLPNWWRRLVGRERIEEHKSLLLMVEPREIFISQYEGVKVVLSIVAPDDFLERIDSDSLRLSGAVSTCHYSQLCGDDQTIRFYGGALPWRLRRDLRSFRQITNDIRVTARAKTKGHPPFSGQASVALSVASASYPSQ